MVKSLILGLSVLGFLFLFATFSEAAASNTKVLMKTTKGDITIELYPDKAPITVENFLTYVKAKFYDGTVFHRVIKGFMVQGGGYNKNYQECEKELVTLREDIKQEVKNGKIEENHFLILDKKIDDYLREMKAFVKGRGVTGIAIAQGETGGEPRDAEDTPSDADEPERKTEEVDDGEELGEEWY